MIGRWIHSNLFGVSKPIIRYEHEYLNVGDDGFTLPHFHAFVKLNEQHGNKYFTVGNDRIKFTQYVGVVQAGNLTVEILPKPDSSEKKDWHKALINILRKAGYLNVSSISDANLRWENATLLELYYLAFLSEVQFLIHAGLVKKYRREQANRSFLKGRLLFSKHVNSNFIHQERFYVEYSTYDSNNTYNQILKCALKILFTHAPSANVVAKASSCLLEFENISDFNPSFADFQKIHYDRKTEPYKKALTLAELIILNFAPTVEVGERNVLAILFDMNILFEKFIYKILKDSEPVFGKYNLTISPQNSKEFWNEITIRPDLVFDFNKDGKEWKIIVDTKWKVLNDLRPADDDLKQMFAYNIHFYSAKSILLYPYGGLHDTEPIFYEDSPSLKDTFRHKCQLMFVDCFNEEGEIIEGLGVQLIGKITSLASGVSSAGIVER